MDEEVQTEAPETAVTEAAAAPAAEPKVAEQPKVSEPPKQDQRPQEKREDRPRREDRPPRNAQGGGGGERRDQRGDRGPDRNRENRGEERRGDDRRGDRRESGRPGGGRPFEGPPEIEIEKLISDSLYLDNQAHAVVARMRDMDSGTKSQLRRLYNAVRRAVRAPESERQHQFVMLRARLAYTIARHSLRSLDALERLLLQVTRKNDARGYERFKDLFEAIVAYNE
jgi:CRISPR type III-A-associated protein Csm2